MEQLKTRAYDTAQKSELRSKRYQHITTAEIGDIFEQHGFKMVKYSEARSLKQTDVGYAKHIARFRHESLKYEFGGGLVPDIVVVNSHNGKSSLQFMIGFYRLVCANGLVVGRTLDTVKFLHIGDDLHQRIVAEIPKVMELVAKASAMVKQMETTILTLDQQKQLAQKMAAWRLEQMAKVNSKETLELGNIDNVLRHHRWADRKDDLFTVMNRVQENILRVGGVQYSSKDNETGMVEIKKTRAFENQSKLALEFNRVLWDTAAQLAA